LQMREAYQQNLEQLQGQLQSSRIQLRNNVKKQSDGIMRILFSDGGEGIWVFSCGVFIGVGIMFVMIALGIYEWGPVRG